MRRFRFVTGALLTAATALVLAAPAHADTTPVQPDATAIEYGLLGTHQPADAVADAAPVQSELLVAILL